MFRFNKAAIPLMRNIISPLSKTYSGQLLHSSSKIRPLLRNDLFSKMTKEPKMNIHTKLKDMNFAGRRAKRSVLEGEIVSESAAKPKRISSLPISIGRGATAAAAGFGLLALAYYGLGMSSEAGAFDRSNLWPSYVRERIRATYAYFGSSLGFTAIAAMAIARNPTALAFVSRNGLMAMIGSIALIMGTGAITRSLPYEGAGFNGKTLSWMVHASVLGALIAPMTMLGGQLLLRAAWYTAGIVGSLSLVAATAPSEKFLNMGGPLAIGLGLVFVSSLG
ncbi:hypothetical protein SNEBB_005382 [Seison nebaliae]|nr:hypothetical protein SNEBB_005382 [Seison nebaliae]